MPCFNEYMHSILDFQRLITVCNFLHIFILQQVRCIGGAMNETLFQYLWSNKLFKANGLKTTEGEAVHVLHPGTINTNAGPDFLEGRVRIADTIWVGNIELHLKSSDWHKHKHTEDPNYRNIILHVVYEDDKPLENTTFPTLEMKHCFEEGIIERYHYLMKWQHPVSCRDKINAVPDIVLNHWLDSLLAERWEVRLEEWQLYWKGSVNDWRTLLYYRLASNFGFHVNRDVFLELALSLPLDILAKHRKNIVQVEALLFGQSGLLAVQRQDSYMQLLEKEYHFLRRKYQLTPIPAHRWKFLRMRPANFPTVRIAQFAMLVHKSLDLFARMMEIENEKELYALLNIHASNYWDNHYRFNEVSEEVQVKYLGKDAIQNILINTVAPMQYLYAKLQGKSSLTENSIHLLQSIKAEKNNILHQWKHIGIEATDAARSQALLQLFNQYCSRKKCLDCAIGNHLIRKGS